MPLLELLDRVLVLEELVGRDHRDAVPRADLVAERAADAAGKVDRADLKDLLMRGPGIVLMQSTGQTIMHASQPVHMSSSSRARTLGSFFLAIADT